jgi:hypothetical protein
MAHTACRDMDSDTGADPVEGGIAVVRSTWPTLSLGQAALFAGIAAAAYRQSNVRKR